MTKVICEDCGNIQHSYAKWFWKCNKCGKKQIVENSIYEDDQNQTSKTNAKSEQEESEGEVKPLSSPSPQTQEEEENVLEIETYKEEEEEEPKAIMENKEEDFRCSECNAVVKEFQDCENCGTELIWSEE